MRSRMFRLLAWYCAFAPFVQIALAVCVHGPLGIQQDVLAWSQQMAVWALPMSLYFQAFCCYCVDNSPGEHWIARTLVIFLCQIAHNACYTYVFVLGLVSHYAPGAMAADKDVETWFLVGMMACMMGSSVALLLASDMHKRLETKA